MEHKLPKRKNIRISKYNYSKSGFYFLTICVYNREKLLSQIIYDENKNEASVELSSIGKISEKYIKSINQIYKNINICDYVIMPNHIHMICEIIQNNGSSGTPTPTNHTIPFIVSTFKRLTNKEIGNKIWQRNYYEHIIRNEKEYLEILEYIYNNPLRWNKDKYFYE